MNTKDQIITSQYAIYNSDCMEVMPTLPDNSVDMSVYSPPFAGLYNYSSSERDFSNCENKEQFLEQYEYLIAQIGRVTKPGRVTAVHCTDVFDNSCRLWDFPHEIIRLHEKYGFQYRNRITIWKEPLKVRMRTMVKSLMHKLIVEDSTQCFTAMPDYVLVFTKKGDNAVPVTHPHGLKRYFGETPILPNILRAFNNANESKKSCGNTYKTTTKTTQTRRATNCLTTYGSVMRQAYGMTFALITFYLSATPEKRTTKSMFTRCSLMLLTA
jgi:DNA modification methylase